LWLFELLGNLPVLTKGTAQVTADKTNGENPAAGKEVEEGLFFNRVDGQGGNQAFQGENYGATLVEPCPADSP
jgi:hypothetical protein